MADEVKPNPADDLIQGSYGEDTMERGNPRSGAEETDDVSDDQLEDGVSEDEGASDDGNDVEDSDDGGDDDDTSEAEEETTDEDEAPKKKNNVPARKRISQLTKAKNEALARAQEAEARLAEIEAKGRGHDKDLTGPGADDNVKEESPKAEAPKKPDPKDFEYGEFDPDYQTAKDEYLIEEAQHRLEQKQETRRVEAEQSKREAEVYERYNATVAKGVEKYDDFDEVVVEGAKEGRYPLSQEMAAAAIQSDVGADVIYELASNPEEAERIANLPPLQQLVAFGRLEAKYTENSAPPKKPQQKKVTSAPPPPKKRASGGTASKKFDPATASFEEIEKRWNEKGRV